MTWLLRFTGSLGASALLVTMTARACNAAPPPADAARPEDQLLIGWLGGTFTSTLTRTGTHAGGGLEAARLWADQIAGGAWFRWTTEVRIGDEDGHVDGLVNMDVSVAAPLGRSDRGTWLLGGGLRGEYFASHDLAISALAPYALAGYRFRTRSMMLLVAARGGAVPTGRFDPASDLAGNLGGTVDVGGQASLALRGVFLPLVVDVRWASYVAVTRSARVDELVASACSWFVCTDLRVYGGDALTEAGAAVHASAVFGGLSLLSHPPSRRVRRSTGPSLAGRPAPCESATS